MTVEVGEFFSIDYPTLEGGFTEEVDDLQEFVDELRQEYAHVGEPIRDSAGWFVKVYEN